MIGFWLTETREWIATTLVPIAVVLIPLMLLRQNRKTKEMRAENAADHGIVQQKLGELTGSVTAQSAQIEKVEVKVDDLGHRLSEHIGSHNPLPAVVVQVPAAQPAPTVGD